VRRRAAVLLLLVAMLIWGGAEGYQSVVMMHGYGGTASDFTELSGFIAKHHPGTPTILLNIYNDAASFAPMWLQADGMILALSKLNLTEEYILIGHSQGALLSRSVIQMMNDHRVSKFISLAGPQMGQYGIVGDWPNPWNLTDEFIYEVFYTPVVQDLFSAANYWNDPFHRDAYLREVVYLPVINNQTHNPDSALYKQNVLRTKEMHFFGGPQDGTIQPWQSTQWGFWADKMEDNKIIPMEQQPIFINDYLGLRTLHEQGRLFVTSVPGVDHGTWINNEGIFVKYILPLLD